MSGSGSQIAASDFVTIQDKAQSLLGTGSTTRGYGQPVQSADVFAGNEITKAQWDFLRYDIVNIRLHQDGVLPNIVTVNVGDVIGYGAGSPNTNYDTLLETAIANRFQIAQSQSVVANKGTATTSSSWSASATMELTITFANSNDARYFFNSGGKVRITPTLTGGNGTAQVNAWTNFLTSVGTQSFGAANVLSNYYTLTNSYQTYYQNSLSTPYSANNINLSAKTNVADNSSGTATILYLKVTLNDAYVDVNPSPPGDLVNGTLSLSIDELKATGALIPSGTFVITSPSYSLSSITLS
jgi:hypothetical protein